MSAWSKTGMFSLGMAAGVVVALLVAPQAGEDSRAYLSDAARKGMDHAKEKGSQWAKRTKEAAGQMGEKSRDYVERAREAGESGYEKAKDALS